MLLMATVCAGVKEVITDTAQLNHSENTSAVFLIITNTFVLCVNPWKPSSVFHEP